MSTRAMTTTTTAHVSTGHLASALPSSFTVKPRRRTFSSNVRCALYPQTPRQSRRSVSLSLVFLHFFSLTKFCISFPFVCTYQLYLAAADAIGATAFDKYVKKKKLDPLEAYVPAVILTELQIKELGQYLEVGQPKFADCRSLLRSGPAASLRVNIRAVAEYASDAGNGKSASNDVDQCLRALEELDSLFLRASRNESNASIESMKVKIVTALNALNSLLKTVPAEVLDKGQAMADAYTSQAEDVTPESIDPQLKQLESIL
ncbi:hypothetical protein BUALT_Bualt10G0133700 [Buddleja alternifolia]|uniref:DUF7880 domain-containing protein n=1 Tax=Buddleja alternifolia TaxID=168488 RepID=A0AAV6X070_9LAMI|nr:hypothetical protein BUALT_Bualt10G0133700 [Buddleja alternifolia]